MVQVLCKFVNSLNWLLTSQSRVTMVHGSLGASCIHFGGAPSLSQLSRMETSAITLAEPIFTVQVWVRVRRWQIFWPKLDVFSPCSPRWLLHITALLTRVRVWTDLIPFSQDPLRFLQVIDCSICQFWYQFVIFPSCHGPWKFYLVKFCVRINIHMTYIYLSYSDSLPVRTWIWWLICSQIWEPCIILSSGNYLSSFVLRFGDWHVGFVVCISPYNLYL